jgi:hypothetical protein
VCILCYGLTGEEHWTDARVGTEASTSLRARRRALLSQLLDAHGLDYRDDTTGVTSLVSNRKGSVEVARSLGEVWAAAEKLTKHPLDPLEPALLERIGSETPPA